MPREELHKLQLRRLRKTIGIAANSPYYKQVFQKHGITADSIRSIEDIRKIPFPNWRNGFSRRCGKPNAWLSFTPNICREWGSTFPLFRRRRFRFCACRRPVIPQRKSQKSCTLRPEPSNITLRRTTESWTPKIWLTPYRSLRHSIFCRTDCTMVQLRSWCRGGIIPSSLRVRFADKATPDKRSFDSALSPY